MRPLAALERFLERLFERPTARLFGRPPGARDARPAPGADDRRGAPGRRRTACSRRHASRSRSTRPTRPRWPACASARGRARRGRPRRTPVGAATGSRERPTVALVGDATLDAGRRRGPAGVRRRPPARGRRRTAQPRSHRWSTRCRRPIPAGAVLRDPRAGRARARRRARRAPADDRARRRRRRRRSPTRSCRATTRGSRPGAGASCWPTSAARTGRASTAQGSREAVVGPGDRIEVGATRIEIVVPSAAGRRG